MRKAEAQRAWGRAIGKDRGFRVTSVVTNEKRPLGNFAHDLPNGLVLVCGLNGVGKTTLLRLLFEALGGDHADLRDELRSSGTFECTVRIDGDDFATPFEDGTPIAVSLLDAADECAQLFSLARQPNFEDLLEGFDPREWTETEMAEARFVVGKAYNAIRVTEFDDPGPPISLEEPSQVDSMEHAEAPSAQEPDDAVLAFLEVEVDGVSYDFRSMGLGEFAALILLWRLQRLRANTVVLLEEPETYLSARASSALLSILARTVDDERLYAVVTTHSPGHISEAPLSCVRILMPHDGAMTLREPSSSAELEYMLGLPTGPARVVLVEDQTARDFVRELVGRYADAWVGSVSYLPTSGEEALLDICKKFPKAESLYLVGVLDADQDLPTSPPTWPVFRLPGPENPDSVLRRAVLADLEGLAALCGREVASVTTACEVNAGEDEHDWFHAVAEYVGLDVHGLRRHAVSMWLRDPDNAKSAKELVDDVLAALTGRT